MIYPTARAVVLTALGAPLGLGAGLIAPNLWVAAGAWLALILGLMLLDVLMAPASADVALEIETPGALGIGRGAIGQEGVGQGGIGGSDPRGEMIVRAKTAAGRSGPMRRQRFRSRCRPTTSWRPGRRRLG